MLSIHMFFLHSGQMLFPLFYSFFCGYFLSHPGIPLVMDFGQSVLFIVSICFAAYLLWDFIDFYTSFSFHMDSVQYWLGD